MTCNLLNNEASIVEAFRSVSESTGGGEWCLLDYDGNSNIVQVAQRGDEGGLAALLQRLHSGHVQYGFFSLLAAAASEHQQQAQRKIVMIHWGEGVPAARLAQTASHAEEIRRLLRPIHTTILARSEEDVEMESLQRQLAQKLQITQQQQQTASHGVFVPPAVPSTPTKPKAADEPALNLTEREKFWQQQLQEEEDRRREELAKRDFEAKQFAEERRRLENQLHAKAVKLQQQKSASVDQSHPPPVAVPNPARGKLIRGRTELFESKVQELAASIPKPLIKPKAFKYQVAVQDPNKQPPPVNALLINDADGGVPPTAPPKHFECELLIKPKGVAISPLASENKGGSPVHNGEPVPAAVVNGGGHQPIASMVPQIPIQEVSPVKQPPTAKQLQPPMEENNNEQAVATVADPKSTRARAVWDYQAEDATEISFDPDDIICDVEQLHDGWWRGRTANGTVGLFPSNYVELI